MVTESIEAKVEAMDRELTRLRDIDAIRRVEHAYNYYLVMWMHDEIIDLFADRDDTTLEWPEGTFFGKDGLSRFYRNINPNKDPEFLHQMMHLSDIIDIAEDGKTGKGRWWGFGAIAVPQGDGGIVQAMVCGVYENDFIKENDIWKLWKIKWVPVYYFLPAVGWVKEEQLVGPGPPLPGEEGEASIPDWWQSDLPTKNIPYSYPSGYILPFHFKHPVTGKKTTEGELNKRVKNIKNE
jgi:hypothetical protein